jgi:hypothetical protein
MAQITPATTTPAAITNKNKINTFSKKFVCGF